MRYTTQCLLLLCTLLLSALATGDRIARASGPASSQPAPGNSGSDPNSDGPPADAHPDKRPGCLSTPFPIPVPEDLPRHVPGRDTAPPSYLRDPMVGMLGKIDQSLLLGYLDSITSFGPRVTQTGACAAAGAFIFDEFQAMGLDVRYHSWSLGGYQDNNIEATLYGSDPASSDIFVICAHYDSVPGSPGADDNGSGVVAILSAAFAMRQFDFRHTIRFVAFSGEEQGLLGSHEYAEDAYLAGDNIVATLNADMIGFAQTAADEGQVKVFSNGPSLWLRDYTVDMSALYGSHIDLTVLSAGSTSGSDHWYFWEYGYDALFYHEFNFNDYYHSPQDIVANMNVGYHVKVARLVAATAAGLAEISFPEAVPTISAWGSGVMAMVLLTGGTFVLRNRRRSSLSNN